MRAVVTRVSSASVTIDGKVNGEIGRGYLVLLGVGPGDTRETARKLADKICNLRVFEDEKGKMNLDLATVGGSLLVVSQFTLFADNGVVKVEYDINSLTTYTQDIGEVFHLNRTMRLCNTIANDIYRQFSDNYIGAVNNNDAGRTQFQAAIVGYLLDIQAQNGIENFTADDVQVAPGTAIDAVVVTIGIQPVGSINKIYMTIEVS